MLPGLPDTSSHALPAERNRHARDSNASDGLEEATLLSSRGDWTRPCRVMVDSSRCWGTSNPRTDPEDDEGQPRAADPLAGEGRSTVGYRAHAVEASPRIRDGAERRRCRRGGTRVVSRARALVEVVARALADHPDAVQVRESRAAWDDAARAVHGARRSGSHDRPARTDGDRASDAGGGGRRVGGHERDARISG